MIYYIFSPKRITSCACTNLFQAVKSISLPFHQWRDSKIFNFPRFTKNQKPFNAILTSVAEFLIFTESRS